MGVWHPAEKTIEYRFWEEGSAKATTKKFKIKYYKWVCGAVVAQLTLNQLVVGSTPTTPKF